MDEYICITCIFKIHLNTTIYMDSPKSNYVKYLFSSRER